uniref:Uncharacterized protein n=1 Tax=Anguilla anguilla TaxID=7936 RepID=A0A0E9TQV4_ANGAN
MVMVFSLSNASTCADFMKLLCHLDNF